MITETEQREINLTLLQICENILAGYTWKATEGLKKISAIKLELEKQ